MEKLSLTEHEQASIAGSCGAVPLASGARVAARGPSLLGCLFAHWRHILRPDRAARVILAGRSWQAAGAVLLALVEINAVLLIEIGAPLADAWPAVVLAVLAFAWVAWVQLPQVHRTGLLRHSYWRSLCACSGTAGFLVGQMVLVPWLILVLDGLRNWDIAILLVIATASVLTLQWFGRAARGASGRCADVHTHPLCEGCGYDLTHRPADGRCPECGLVLAASLDPSGWRWGGYWATRRGPSAWAKATWQIIFRPGRFYRLVRMRGGAARERAFCRWTYQAIALGALVWLACCGLCASVIYDPSEQFLGRGSDRRQ